MIRWSAALFVASLLAPSLLSAHAYLIKSVPAQRAVLFRAPAKIQLWFNERLEPRYSSIAIADVTGNPVDVGKTEVDAKDPKQLSASIKSLPAGRYVVKYRVLSVDGHIVQDQFPFTVKQ
jgi:methionine-rich copper-binding protein CopC